MTRFLLVLPLVLTPIAAALAQPKGEASDRVAFTGCPMQGVEGGCLVIQAPDGTAYDISSARPRPRPGYLRVRLTGRKSDRVGICQQGQILENIRWTYTKQRCPKPQ